MAGTTSQRNDVTQPSSGGSSITLDDSNDLSTFVRALYIGSGGAVKVTTVNGDVLTFSNTQNGSVLPVQCRRVWSTGTTAANIIGLY